MGALVARTPARPGRRIGAWLGLCAALAGWARADTLHCVTLEYPPLEYADNSQVTGMAVDVVRAVLAGMGHTLEVEVYPWARSLELVRLGQRDCIFTAYRTPEREAFLEYSRQVLIPQPVYLFVRKDSGVSFNGDLAALRGHRIGVVNRISYGNRFDSYRPRLKLDEAETLEQSFQKLVLGRVDAVPSNLYTATYTLAGPSRPIADQIEQLPVPVEVVPSYLAFTRRRNFQGLRDRFDAELAKLVQRGEYRRIVESYHIPYSWLDPASSAP